MYPDARVLHQALFRALKSALALTASEADKFLIRAYSDVPAPEPPPSANVCYYFLQTDPTAPLPQEERTVSNQAEVFSFLPVRINLVFYGEACEAWAHHVRSFFFLDGDSQPRKILREAGLYPIPKPRPPAILYEELAKVFRKRADLVIEARLADTAVQSSVTTGKAVKIPTIRQAPSVTVHVPA